MAITRPPRRPAPATEAAVEQFIAGEVARIKRTNKAAVIIRFDRAVLQRLDREATLRGISRSAWVALVVSHALDEADRRAV